MEVGGRLLTKDKYFDVVDQIETIILGTSDMVKQPQSNT
jgi:hypothetical protein